MLQELPYPRAKSAKVGEVGWGVVKLMDYSLLKSGHQIMVHIQPNNTIVPKCVMCTYSQYAPGNVYMWHVPGDWGMQWIEHSYVRGRRLGSMPWQ